MNQCTCHPRVEDVGDALLRIGARGIELDLEPLQHLRVQIDADADEVIGRDLHAERGCRTAHQLEQHCRAAAVRRHMISFSQDPALEELAGHGRDRRRAQTELLRNRRSRHRARRADQAENRNPVQVTRKTRGPGAIRHPQQLHRRRHGNCLRTTRPNIVRDLNLCRSESQVKVAPTTTDGADRLVVEEARLGGRLRSDQNLQGFVWHELWLPPPPAGEPCHFLAPKYHVLLPENTKPPARAGVRPRAPRMRAPLQRPRRGRCRSRMWPEAGRQTLGLVWKLHMPRGSESWTRREGRPVRFRSWPGL